MSDEFSYKFDDAQLKNMLQMLNKSFGTLEDSSSTEHRSSEKEKKSTVQRYRAKVSKYNQTKQSKADQSQTKYFFCKKLEH